MKSDGQTPEMPQQWSDSDPADELLSAFIDGELTGRQQTEVHRLVAHDAQIAQRLHRLEACRKLLGSLPPAEAPAGLADRILACVRGGAAPLARYRTDEQRKGVLQLYMRRIVAAAAMIALLGILAAVVYEIVSPVQPGRPLAQDGTATVSPADVVPPAAELHAASTPAVAFEGRLILTTSDLAGVNAFVKKVIETNGIVRYDLFSDPRTGSTYILSCDRERLNMLLQDLDTIWNRLYSTTLVMTAADGAAVAVSNVTIPQIMRVVGTEDALARIRLARDFAVLNGVHQMMPARGLMAATGTVDTALLSIPKPVLTGGDETTRPGPVQPGRETISITLIIAAAEN